MIDLGPPPYDDDDPFYAPAQPVGEPPWLRGLNDPQRQAVLTTSGPVLVLAGAGSGKTKALVCRMAHLIGGLRVWPSQILAVTFTNKAAREMRERVADLVGPAAQDLWLGTFHALAARILRRHAELVGLNSNFTILDADDQLRLIKQLLPPEQAEDKRWPARALLAVIERWKDRGLTPDQVTAASGANLADGRALTLYRAYQDRLRGLNACDFGDLLLHGLTVLQRHPPVLEQWRGKFRHILVDEYQDTNVAQYLWMRLLAGESASVCCVGDEDQSIYSWRGAEVGNILRFEQDFPGAAVVRLEQNYRSTAPILAAASGLIAHNEERLGKTLWTEQDGGDLIKIQACWDAEEEARCVGEEIEAQGRAGISYGQMAILVRAGFQTREFEDRLTSIGAPYRVVGGLRFYERQEARDAIAYLRLTVQPDDDLAFERIVNTPRRGLGDATLRLLSQAARLGGCSLTAAARLMVATDELKPAPRRALGGLIADLDRWRAMADGLPPAEVAETILEESGYLPMLRADKSIEAPGRIENLKELVAATADFDTLGGFLEHVALAAERAAEPASEQVSIMTLHASKGLEFDVVFLPGWEEKLFPNQRALDEGGLKALEEERRLAYVGLTRARRRAFILHAANRRIHGQWQSGAPSRFLEELPDDQVERAAPLGLDAPSGGRRFGRGGDDDGWSQRPSNADRWAQQRATAPTLEGRATRIDKPKSSGFQSGDAVRHPSFGHGVVTAADGDRLTVAFKDVGVKKVIASFVSKA